MRGCTGERGIMLPSTEREVVQFHIELETDPPGRLGSLQEIGELLIKRVEQGLCVTPIENERTLIAISDARFVEVGGNSKGGLALLFDLVDPQASIAANRHMTTRELRHFIKKDGEGRAVSAHMLLKLTPATTGGKVYQALLENAVGLGRSRVGPHLQRQVKQLFKDHEVTVEDADGAQQIARPAVRMNAVYNDKLKSTINDAELSEVKLVQTDVSEGAFDPPDIAKVQRREMRLKLDVPMHMSAKAALDTITPWAKKQGFQELHVRWRPKPESEASLGGAVANLHNRAKIDLNNADIGEALCARRHFVTLDSDMSDCVEKIRDDMVSAMAALI
jgi:hypothetical protein